VALGTGWTSLHSAVDCGNIEMVGYLSSRATFAVAPAHLANYLQVLCAVFLPTPETGFGIRNCV